MEKARTGRRGDGKIFVYPVAEVIRMRTGETGKPPGKLPERGGASFVWFFFWKNFHICTKRRKYTDMIEI